MEFLSWLLMEDVQRIRATFSAGGPYGAPSLLGALFFAGLYYVGRRRARSRSMSLRAFVRTIFAKRILLHPSSLVDFRLWTINAIVLAAAYGLLAVGNLACRDLVVGALTRGFGAHAPLAWPIWLVMGIATLFELLAYEFGYWGAHYTLPSDPGALGIPQGPPFRRGDDDADRNASASGRDHRLRERDRGDDRERVRRDDLCVRPGRRPLHPVQRQRRPGAVPVDVGPSAPQPYLDRLHRPRGTAVPEPRASPDPSFDRSRGTSTRISATRWRSGTGRSARSTSLRSSARSSNTASASRVAISTARRGR